MNVERCRLVGKGRKSILRHIVNVMGRDRALNALRLGHSDYYRLDGGYQAPAGVVERLAPKLDTIRALTDWAVWIRNVAKPTTGEVK